MSARAALLLVLVAAAPAAAQPASGAPASGAPASGAPAETLRALREAAARLDGPAADSLARAALARFDAFAPDALVEVHTLYGVVLHAGGAAVEARRQFEAALSLDPGLRLDSVLVSPKTVEFFDAVRAEARAAPAAAAPTVRYVVLADPRPGAALRSALLPGWGQFHKGDRGRGWAFAAGVGALAAGTAAAHVARGSARARYLAAVEPGDIARTYARYDGLTRLRTALSVATAVGWAASVAEALATGGPAAPDARVAAGPGGAGLALRVRL